MKATTSDGFDPYSEQNPKNDPKNGASGHAPAVTTKPLAGFAGPKKDASFHALLLRQALLRGQIQTAIYELVRGYEAKTGFTVVRLDLQAEKKRVILEAVPAPR